MGPSGAANITQSDARPEAAEKGRSSSPIRQRGLGKLVHGGGEGRDLGPARGLGEDGRMKQSVPFGEQETMHRRVGGDAWFVGLIDRFYAAVAEDSRLRPLYPDDLTDSKAHMAGFLIQYWGGSDAYSAVRGHPRLRMRHAPFVITNIERDAWLEHMSEAVRAGDLSADDEAEMLRYFSMAADAMVNS